MVTQKNRNLLIQINGIYENENEKWHTFMITRIKRLLKITNNREKIKRYIYGCGKSTLEIIECEQKKMQSQFFFFC